MNHHINDLPTVPASLHISQDFTGRVVAHVKNGRVICDYRLRDNEFVSTLDGFLEIARQSGWSVNLKGSE